MSSYESSDNESEESENSSNNSDEEASKSVNSGSVQGSTSFANKTDSEVSNKFDNNELILTSEIKIDVIGNTTNKDKIFLKRDIPKQVPKSKTSLSLLVEVNEDFNLLTNNLSKTLNV